MALSCPKTALPSTRIDRFDNRPPPANVVPLVAAVPFPPWMFDGGV